MGIGVSVFLLAVGAILTFAVHYAVNGVAIPVVGIILMVAGAIGLFTSLAVFGPRRRATVVQDDTTVPPPGRTTVTREY
ncbi:MAG TPA: DUF6458 family protein [Mycobacteriales bacterium]|jgi:membrane-bound ClpP family serine protease|nr:DUF6458 family protein [Mycobacteriales bacterium]